MSDIMRRMESIPQYAVIMVFFLIGVLMTYVIIWAVVGSNHSENITHEIDFILSDEKETITTSKVSIKIGTFNIKVFGQTKAAKEYVMENLTEIVNKYDIIAIQEIKDIEQKAPYLLWEELNNTTSKQYGMRLSQRTGLQEDDSGSQEQYAIFFDEEKVISLDEGILYDDSLDLFQREPFITRFSTIDGNLTFAIQVIHTKPTVAVQEIDSLHEVFEWSKAQYPDEQNFIMLGDFNAGCDYATSEQLDELEIRNENYTWVIPDYADTNLASSSCPYDRIVFSGNLESHYSGGWGIDEAFMDNTISDHWPVWFEISV